MRTDAPEQCYFGTHPSGRAGLYTLDGLRQIAAQHEGYQPLAAALTKLHHASQAPSRGRNALMFNYHEARLKMMSNTGVQRAVSSLCSKHTPTDVTLCASCLSFLLVSAAGEAYSVGHESAPPCTCGGARALAVALQVCAWPHCCT